MLTQLRFEPLRTPTSNSRPTSNAQCAARHLLRLKPTRSHEWIRLLISESQILTTLRTSLNPTSLHDQFSTAAAPNSNNNAIPAGLTGLTAHTAPSVAKVKSYPIQLLDTLVTRHFRATLSAPLSLSGRQLPLIYLLIATLITSPRNKAVVVIDVDARFDITKVLQCAPYQTPPPEQAMNPVAHGNPPVATQHQRVSVQDLKHLHIYRPARGSFSHIRDVLASAEQHMVYSKHVSVAREWWGTIVIGGGSPSALGSAHVDVTTGWKGWLRVDREEVPGFFVGMSLEEVLSERNQRQRAADAAGFTATCAWGSFDFSDHGGR